MSDRAGQVSAEDDEVVPEKARDIFQNRAFIGSFIMYAAAQRVEAPYLIVGVLSKMFHVDTGDLYKVEITSPAEQIEHANFTHQLNYPEDDFIVIAASTITRLTNEQSIYTKFFSERMYGLRKEIIEREKES